VRGVIAKEKAQAIYGLGFFFCYDAPHADRSDSFNSIKASLTTLIFFAKFRNTPKANPMAKTMMMAMYTII